MDGTLIFQPAAGQVLAQFEWKFAEDVPLAASAKQLTGKTVTRREVFFAGHIFRLPSPAAPTDHSLPVTRHLQPELFGLTFPFALEETTFYEQNETTLLYSEEHAKALAHLHSLQALKKEYPDAEFLAQKVDVSAESNTLHYRVVYTILADICT